MNALLPGKFRSALTFALMLWCAGAGCMIVSYAHAAAMNANVNSISAGPASGSMGTHDCCKARHASGHSSDRGAASSTANDLLSSASLIDREEVAEVPSSSDVINCCPLTSGTFVVNSRERVVNENASMSHGAGAVTVVSSVQAIPLAIPLRLPDQNQTYLRGCVFLI
jgi:hypothetical protein